MAIYRAIACGSTTPENVIRKSCGWVLECNGINQTLPMRVCPHCGNNTVFAQARDPQLLLEWCEERALAAPKWLVNSVPVG